MYSLHVKGLCKNTNVPFSHEFVLFAVLRIRYISINLGLNLLDLQKKNHFFAKTLKPNLERMMNNLVFIDNSN